jgi:radical SAM superfamily enzyme YgiQ (UPF0313 family)
MRILIAASHQKEPWENRTSIFSFLDEPIRTVPLTLMMLSALTPDEYDVEIVDENSYDQVDCSKEYDLVAISCLTMHALRAYKIADEFRKKGVTVILGGYHPSLMPDEAKQHADSVVIGEAEITWPQLLKDFENGDLKSFYRQQKPVDPKIIPVVSRNLGKRYLTGTDIQATRGCPYQCDYCSIHIVEGNRFRKRPIENVIEEIKALKNSFFYFYDNSLTIDTEYTKSLFMEIKGLNKSFGCYGNINTLHDNEELIKLSKEAGCFTWNIGFESISQKSLDSVKKRNKVKKYAEGIKKIRKYGLEVTGLFMFGFDGDNNDIFNNTLKALKEWKVDLADFNILTPFPGTNVYKKFEEEGRILTKDWSKYTSRNVVFEPKNMTPKELFEGTRDVAKNFYSLPSTMRRTFHNGNLDFPKFIHKLRLNLSFCFGGVPF